MAIWKAHGLAGTAEDALVLPRGSKVVATTDLPGVPEGTQGVVLLANGFNWRRHRVRFDNGVEMGDLDGRHLSRLDRRGRPAP
jgi:hypothetical protein